jgi:hypothetical protein
VASSHLLKPFKGALGLPLPKRLLWVGWIKIPAPYLWIRKWLTMVLLFCWMVERVVDGPGILFLFNLSLSFFNLLNTKLIK